MLVDFGKSTKGRRRKVVGGEHHARSSFVLDSYHPGIFSTKDAFRGVGWGSSGDKENQCLQDR